MNFYSENIDSNIKIDENNDGKNNNQFKSEYTSVIGKESLDRSSYSESNEKYEFDTSQFSLTNCHSKNVFEKDSILENLYLGKSQHKLTRQGQYFVNIGQELLSKSCVVYLAGGQGTRLGSNLPKGCYVLQKLQKSLFDLHFERILKMQEKYEVKLRVYIMTSEFTYEETKEFVDHFQSKHEYSLNIEIFNQDSAECLDLDEKPFYLRNNSIVKAPNGNGGLVKAINKAGILEDLIQNSYLYINVVSVDNVLGNVLDPLALGLMHKKKYDILSKGVYKRENENAGCFFKDDDGYKVLEYFEADGRESNLANICHHYFRIDFLVKMKDFTTPIHLAKKKIPFLDSQNNLVKPNEPNGYKQELFIFDFFKFAQGCEVLIVPRHSEFSPLKNGPDSETDNPESCIRDWKIWNNSKKFN